MIKNKIDNAIRILQGANNGSIQAACREALDILDDLVLCLDEWRLACSDWKKTNEDVMSMTFGESVGEPMTQEQIDMVLKIKADDSTETDISKLSFVLDSPLTKGKISELIQKLSTEYALMSGCNEESAKEIGIDVRMVLQSKAVALGGLKTVKTEKMLDNGMVDVRFSPVIEDECVETVTWDYSMDDEGNRISVADVDDQDD